MKVNLSETRLFQEMIVDAIEEHQGYVHSHLENFAHAQRLNIYKELVDKILTPRFNKSRSIKKIIYPHGCEMYKANLHRPYTNQYCDFITVYEKDGEWYHKYSLYDDAIKGAYVKSRVDINFGSKLNWLKFHIELEEDMDKGTFSWYNENIDRDIEKRYMEDTKYATFDTSFDTLSFQRKNRQKAIDRVIRDSINGKNGLIMSIIKDDEFRRLKENSRKKKIKH